MKLQTAALAAALLVTARLPLCAQQTGWPHVDLIAHRDSFIINVQGNPAGTSVFTVQMQGNQARITDNTVIPSMGKQNSEIFADRQGHVSKVLQASAFGGQQSMLSLDYANGHAKGTAIQPGQARAHIDAVIPADAVDENTFQALLPSLAWKDGATWQFQVFSPGNNAVMLQKLTVAAREKITVPAGTFDAYRAELDAAVPVTFWVSADSAHRVLKVAPKGAPFELVLAK